MREGRIGGERGRNREGEGGRGRRREGGMWERGGGRKMDEGGKRKRELTLKVFRQRSCCLLSSSPFRSSIDAYEEREATTILTAKVN